MALVKASDKTVAVINKTIPKKGPPKKVLEEDQYVEALGKIIQRDFFPDIQKLKAQNEYLDAAEQHNVEKMREISARYATARRTPGPETPGAFSETPGVRPTLSSHGRGWEGTATPSHRGAGSTTSNGDGKDSAHARDPTISKRTGKKLSLDQFLNLNTSEDNASFGDLMEQAAKKHVEKHKWLYEKEEEMKTRNQGTLAITQGEVAANRGESESHVFECNTWKYTNKNSLMYVPEGVEDTVEENIEKKKRQIKVVHNNTRLSSEELAKLQGDAAVAEAAAEREKIEKFGIDGKTENQAAPQVKGYSFLASPSPAPGVDASPIMTWGEIEGTPFRLDAGDIPIDTTPGPVFKVPAIPPREELGHRLSEDVHKKHRSKKRKALEAITAVSLSRTPKYSCLASSGRISTMSPAAQRLISKSTALSRSDRALQATYSPLVRPKGSVTPSRTSQDATPIVTPGSMRQSSITDNLLKLKS
jgi:protein DGCR14